MMSEELGMEPIDTKNIWKSSITVGITTAIGSLIPVIPFFFVPTLFSFTTATWLGVVLCGVSLFGVGVYQAVSLVGVWWKSGLRMLAIGLSAAFIGFVIAKIFHATSI